MKLLSKMDIQEVNSNGLKVLSDDQEILHTLEEMATGLLGLLTLVFAQEQLLVIMTLLISQLLMEM